MFCKRYLKAGAAVKFMVLLNAWVSGKDLTFTSPIRFEKDKKFIYCKVSLIPSPEVVN